MLLQRFESKTTTTALHVSCSAREGSSLLLEMSKKICLEERAHARMGSQKAWAVHVVVPASIPKSRHALLMAILKIQAPADLWSPGLAGG